MKTNHPSCLFRALLLGATVVGPQFPARAELYVYEGFGYAYPGTLVPASPGTGGNGGFGWNGAWYTGLVVAGFPINPNSLYPPTEVTAPSGGSIVQSIAPSHGFNAQRYLTPRTIHPGETLWFSVDMASSAVPDTATIVNFEFISGYHMGFYTMSTGGQGQPLHWALVEYGTDYGPEIIPNAPTLLVAELHLDASPSQFTFKFWVNPGPATCAGGEPADSPVATKVFPGNTAFATLNDVQLVVGNSSLSGTSSLHQFDELRIASTYEDVNLAPPPTLTCPGSVTVQCDANVPSPAPDTAAFLAAGGSVSGGAAPVTVSWTSDASSGSCPKTIIRTYTATDACGRMGTCTQTITVNDTTPPVIGAAGADATIECPATPAFTPPTATDNCDSSPQIIELSDVMNPGTCPVLYTRTKTWRAVDACGNPSGTVSQTITVQDTTAPVASTAAGSLDRTVEAGDAAALAAALALAPTFTDACSGATPATALDTTRIPDPNCVDAETMVRSWNAVDACGNPSADFVQNIHIQDTTPPTITCPDDKLIVTGPGPVTYFATATDNADPSPTVTFDPPSGSTFPMGRTPVTCTATDRCGHTRTCTFYVTVTAFGCTAPSQQAYLKASNIRADDYFGFSVAISAAGDTMVIGSAGDASGNAADPSDTSAPYAGAAYVFVRSGSTWSQQAYLKASNLEAGDEFGHSVAISAAGDTIVIGAVVEASGNAADPSDDSAPFAGAAYVFVRSGSTWSQQAYLKASNPEADDEFGYSAAISAAGDTIVIGAFAEASGNAADPSDTSAPYAGAAYVFVRSGSTWSQQAYLKASNIRANDYFGFSVALSAAGDTLVVGSAGEASGNAADPSDTSAPYAGATYVFVRSGSTWSQQAYLKASNLEAGDGFGYSAAISPAGDTIVIGAFAEASGNAADPSDNSAPSAGAAYLFVRSGSIWSQQAYLKASHSRHDDRFGTSVAISATADTIVIGAEGEASGNAADPLDTSANDAGAGYVFVRSGSTWSQQAYLKASNPDAGDSFGQSVAISAAGDTVVIGDPREASGSAADPADNSAPFSGATYTFTLANEPCARDDFFRVPTGLPVLLPVSALLANDAHSRALPIAFAGNDPVTAHGLDITSVGSPVTGLTLPLYPANLPEDKFTYSISDGTQQASATVHLLPVTLPAPPENALGCIPPAGGSGLAIVFNAPAAGTYVLERLPSADFGHPGAVWTEIARQMATAPGVIAFADSFLPGGANYRVRHVP